MSTILQVAPVPDLLVERRMASYEDLIKALEAERAEKEKLRETLKVEKSNVLKMMMLTKQSSCQSEDKRIQIKLYGELQAALLHQQRAVEERERLSAELQATQSVCARLQAIVKTQTALREKLSDQLQDWDRQLRAKTAELEESKEVQSELSNSLQRKHECYEKLFLEYQALLLSLQEGTSSTKLLKDNQTLHENNNNNHHLLTSTAEVPHTPGGQRSCELESTSLGPRDQKLTCEHQNLLAELQSLAAKHEALLSEHRVVLSDYQRLQADHQALQSAKQELQGNLQKKEGDNLKMAAAALLTESQYERSGAELRPIDGQLQSSPEESVRLAPHLVDLQERNREALSAIDQLRGSVVAALTKTLDQWKDENAGLREELRQTLDQASMAVGVLDKDQLQKTDHVELRRELQQEKDTVARLRTKIEKQERIVREQRKARRQSVELDQGLTEQSLLLIKELKSDNTRLQQRLLKEADRLRAYVEKSKAVMGKDRKELEAVWSKYKAALKDASTAHKRAEELEAKLTARESELKELLTHS